MNNTIETHLQKVTIDNIKKWKETSFLAYASCSTSKGRVSLGVTGEGKPAVMVKDRMFTFRLMKSAINAYKAHLA
jgi:hypothetical protein